MPIKVPIGRAKIILAQLVKRAAAGETILITAHGRVRAKLVRLDHATSTGKIIGAMKGEFKVPDDFDAPLPNDVLEAFEGR